MQTRKWGQQPYLPQFIDSGNKVVQVVCCVATAACVGRLHLSSGGISRHPFLLLLMLLSLEMFLLLDMVCSGIM